ncbi:MAG: type II secretion system F family protein [Candidatus Woesearchaeota archaeon]
MRWLVKYIVRRNPALQNKLRIAHARWSPEQYVSKLLFNAIMYSMAFTFFIFLIISRENDVDLLTGTSILSGSFIILFFLFYKFLSLNLDVKIRRIQHDIDREVIYAGRFLLVKLESGTPLFNALIDGMRAHGVASKYFGEIVDDIELGTPIEEALSNAMVLTPSEKFRRILFNVNNSLRLGIDVTTSLQSVIDDLVSEQMNEIQAYSKKLGSISMFYLLLAIVVPSLGMTVIVIILSFMSIRLDVFGYGVLLLIVFMLQIFFISLFRNIRPSVSF